LRDGELQQITRDHTFVQTLVDEGRITAEEADHHPQKNLITNALDGRDDIELDLSVREARVGDRYLLCSDGLSTVVSAATLRDTLADPGDPDQVVETLIELALRGGGPDNITAIVADVVEVERGPSAVPVVVGAASQDASRRTTNGHAAGKAAALAPPPAEDDEPELEDERRGSWLKRTLLLVVVLALLAAGSYAAWRWSRQQYYVGADGTNVAIYRGLTQDIGPLKTSEIYQSEDIALADLPSYQRARVESAIEATSLSDAQRIVRMLGVQAELCQKAAQEQASPSPTPTPTPTPSGTRSGSSARPSGEATRSPTNEPSPTTSAGSPTPTSPAELECGESP